MEVVLYEPEIPPNTGNIARLCAVSGTRLHLIEPLGLRLEDRYLKRAGLDYWPHVRMDVWPDYGAFLKDAAATRPGARVVLTSAHPGGMPIQRVPFRTDDILVFGPETRGFPRDMLEEAEYRVRIPMLRGHGRCINLSTSCGIVLYAALAQSGALDGPDWE